jgi:hypothetical protein
MRKITATKLIPMIGVSVNPVPVKNLPSAPNAQVKFIVSAAGMKLATSESKLA